MQSLNETDRLLMRPVVDALDRPDKTLASPLVEPPASVMLNRKTGTLSPLVENVSTMHQDAGDMIPGQIARISSSKNSPAVLIARDEERPLEDDEVDKLEQKVSPHIFIFSAAAIRQPQPGPTS